MQKLRSKQTTRIEANIIFSNGNEKDTYKFILSHAANDTLIFNEETLSWKTKNKPKPFKITLTPGLKESGLFEETKKHYAKMAKIIYNLLRKCQVFQFHDTSKNARVRNKTYIQDNQFLRSDGGNLAAFLYLLKSFLPSHKNHII